MIVGTLEALAELIAARGDATTAARLFGATDTTREAIGGPRAAIAGADYARTIASLRESLGKETLVSALATGRGMSLDQVLIEARAILDGLVSKVNRLRLGSSVGLVDAA